MKHHRKRSVDSVSITEEVREFYQRHPYPPPVENLDRYRERWDDTQRRRADFHLFEPAKPYREDRTILIAGCGTSQAAKYAVRWPNAKITGIDVSSTGIEQTERLKQKYRLDNLEVVELPVERATELECSFDHVVCTGVLHHLPDPDKGLQALRDVLDRQGSMHLMVYAPYGRAGIYLLQDYCRRLGIGTSSKEIEDLAESLRALPQDHPLVPLLRGAPDFRSKAGLADALLNPQDRAFTVPELFDFIDQAGLAFGRWVRQAPYLPHCGELAKTPHCGRLTQLPPPEQYAAVELFRGTIVRHNVIVYRNDQPGGSQVIRFDDERWPGHIPIRLPTTICVEKRLPPGAAAVLINQSHTFSDLVLPIDSAEKRLFDAIDGKRTIAEIIGNSAGSEGRQQHCERAHAFFEQLWRYDQVVFDASNQSSHSGADPSQQNLSTSHDR